MKRNKARGSSGSGKPSRPAYLDRIEVLRSPIHGRGLFAKKRIRTGAYIATFEGKRTNENGMHVLWALDEEGREFGIRGQNELRFLNHSRDPNSEFIGTDLYALRNIQSGAELTIDYGEGWEEDG